MNEPEMRAIVARNLARLRKEHQLTQSALARDINYSDKSVSKWERGEGLPDLFVAASLAERFQVSVDDLIRDHEEKQIANDAAIPRGAYRHFSLFFGLSAVDPGLRRRNVTRRLVQLMSVCVCWLAATLVFFGLRLFAPGVDRAWLCFIWGVPASFGVWLVFACLWWTRLEQFISSSLLVWGLAMGIHLSFRIPGIWLIYCVTAVVQLLLCLWFLLLRVRKKKGAPDDDSL